MLLTLITVSKTPIAFFRSSFVLLSTSSIYKRNHYESLGVARNATQSDIKAAYYKLSLLYHPDRNDSDEAAKSFREITEAYEVIGNFKLRKMYDRGLLGNIGVSNDASRSYTNYNPNSSQYKNKPTYHDRMSVYNFDAWSRFHYGNTFSSRNDAKMRYEEKASAASNQQGQARNENVILTIFSLTLLLFLATYTSKETLDNPHLTKKEQP